MRVLVTGGSGFVGAAVVAEAVRRGHEVSVFRRRSSTGNRLQLLADRIEWIDLAGPSAIHIRRAVETASPQAIVHAAWQGVDASTRQALDQVTVNIPFSLALADAARAVRSACFVGIGSQAEYGVHDYQISEDVAPQPTTLYGAAKLAVAQTTSDLLAGTSTRFAWLRIFSSYGPGDNPWWVLNYTIRELLDGRRPTLTSCEQIWDYVYIDDVARAILGALEDDRAQGIFNVGSGVPVVLRDVLTMARDMIDPSLRLGFGERPSTADQLQRLHADIRRLQTEIGWSPTVTLEEGLSAMIAAERLARRRAFVPTN